MRPIAIIVCLIMLVGAGSAIARNPWLSEFKAYYGVADNSRLDTCNVCHVPNQPYSQRNPYGIDLKNIGDIGNDRPAAFAATNDLDSDGDTWLNGVEISYDRFPGDPTDIVPVEETSWGKIKALYGN